jgi:hypothetical protein
MAASMQLKSCSVVKAFWENQYGGKTLSMSEVLVVLGIQISAGAAHKLKSGFTVGVSFIPRSFLPSKSIDAQQSPVAHFGLAAPGFSIFASHLAFTGSALLSNALMTQQATLAPALPEAREPAYASPVPSPRSSARAWITIAFPIGLIRLPSSIEG